MSIVEVRSISTKRQQLLPVEYIRSQFDIYGYVLNKCGGSLSGRTTRGYRNVIGTKLCGLAVREDCFKWHALGIEGDALDLVSMLRFGILFGKLDVEQTELVLAEASAWMNGMTSDGGTRALTLAHEETPPVLKGKVITSMPWGRIASYEYLDEDGYLLYNVDQEERDVIYDNAGWVHEKRRRTWYPGVGGQRVYDMRDRRRVLYRLRQVVNARKKGRPIVLTKSEEAVEALQTTLRQLRSVAEVTTCPGGFRKWREFQEEYKATLLGAEVYVWPAASDRESDLCRRIVRSLEHVTSAVSIIDPNGVARLCGV